TVAGQQRTFTAFPRRSTVELSTPILSWPSWKSHVTAPCITDGTRKTIYHQRVQRWAENGPAADRRHLLVRLCHFFSMPAERLCRRHLATRTGSPAAFRTRGP